MRKRRKVDIVRGIRQYGMLLPFLTRSTRRGAIAAARDHWQWDVTIPPWGTLRSHGFTVHKMEVRDVR